MKSVNVLSAIISLVFVVFLSSTVLAVPGIPHQIYGTVTINGAQAPDGSVVSVRVDGVEVKTATVSSGEYMVIVDDPEQSRAGKTMEFYVNGINTGKTLTFCNGCVDRLDLSVMQTSTTPGGGGSSGGGSGGGGYHGGAGGAAGGESSSSEEVTAEEEVSGTPEEEEECREKWVCTDWGPCTNGRQTRTCWDENNCGTELYKPFEVQPCVSEEVTQESSFDFSATGRFLTSPVGVGVIGLVIVGIAGAVFFWKRKGKSQR